MYTLFPAIDWLEEVIKEPIIGLAFARAFLDVVPNTPGFPCGTQLVTMYMVCYKKNKINNYIQIMGSLCVRVYMVSIGMILYKTKNWIHSNRFTKLKIRIGPLVFVDQTLVRSNSYMLSQNLTFNSNIKSQIHLNIKITH